MKQDDINIQNAQFWDELCGTYLAKSIGINKVSVENLQRFDKAYLDLYPYLHGYVEKENIRNKRVLEIGLGYGTMGQILAAGGSDYYGLDIAAGPVSMMQYRLSKLKKNDLEKVQIGSALNIPYKDESFHYVYTIGCLHHTGNIEKAVSEVFRVLAKGGKAIVMLYNKNSYRQLIHVPIKRIVHFFQFKGKEDFDEKVRKLYDSNTDGSAAPHTDYVSKADVEKLFAHFAHVTVDVRNSGDLKFFGLPICRRKYLLNNLGRTLGLDLYIIAVK